MPRKGLLPEAKLVKMESTRDVQRRQLVRESGGLDAETKRWQPNEFRTALDMYLDGAGFRSIALHLKRDIPAVENVLKSDLPRNYRNCVHKWLAKASNAVDRTHKAWTDRENNYLDLLIEQGRDIEEIALILQREQEGNYLR